MGTFYRGMNINVDFASSCVFPVSGGWCEWSEWTPCSRTCGAESMTRYRSCGCPELKAGGAACSGDQEIHNGVGVQIQRQPCPVITFCPGKRPSLIITIVCSYWQNLSWANWRSLLLELFSPKKQLFYVTGEWKQVPDVSVSHSFRY